LIIDRVAARALILLFYGCESYRPDDVIQKAIREDSPEVLDACLALYPFAFNLKKIAAFLVQYRQEGKVLRWFTKCGGFGYGGEAFFGELFEEALQACLWRIVRRTVLALPQSSRALSLRLGDNLIIQEGKYSLIKWGLRKDNLSGQKISSWALKTDDPKLFSIYWNAFPQYRESFSSPGVTEGTWLTNPRIYKWIRELRSKGF
jgi:hypothetical protein